MSRRLDVLSAVKALAVAALPDADVQGLDNEAPIPQRAAPGGRVIVRTGDIGEPEVDLSPLRYNYEHRIPIELTGWRDSGATTEEVLDQMMTAIGARIELDRTLGGLCDWIEGASPLTEDIYIEGAAPEGRANFEIVATYSTPNPLT